MKPETAPLAEAVETLAEARPRRFRPYPAYRPSGVMWLGSIPLGWAVMPVKRLFRILNGATPRSSAEEYWDGDIAWCTPDDLGDLRGAKIEGTRRRITEAGYENCGTNLAPADSIIVSTRAPIGHIGLAAIPMCTNQGCRALAPLKPLSSRFFYYALLSARPELQSLGQGSTFLELARTKLAAVEVASPPLTEQQVIAAFLDRETAKIDGLVEKKRRLIDLLKEKRTALISRAVTKGLNPTAPMKPSGIDWLGDVPAHWQIKQLKYAVTFQRGHDLPQDERVSGEIPLVTSAGIEAWIDHAIAKAPGIVTGRYGTVGEFHLIEQDYWPLNTTLYSIHMRGNLPQFLWYMLQTLKDVFLVNAGKSAVPGVDRNDLHAIPVAVPPRDEQVAIVGHLDEECERMNRLSLSAETVVARLHEYRSALISAAVTGKIDVRGEAG